MSSTRQYDGSTPSKPIITQKKNFKLRFIHNKFYTEISVDLDTYETLKHTKILGSYILYREKEKMTGEITELRLGSKPTLL